MQVVYDNLLYIVWPYLGEVQIVDAYSDGDV